MAISRCFFLSNLFDLIVVTDHKCLILLLLFCFFLSCRMSPNPNPASKSCILQTGASKHPKNKKFLLIKFKSFCILFLLLTLTSLSSFSSLPLPLPDLQAALWLPADVQPNLEPTSANCISVRRYISDVSLAPAPPCHWQLGVHLVLCVQAGDPLHPGSPLDCCHTIYGKWLQPTEMLQTIQSDAVADQLQLWGAGSRRQGESQRTDAASQHSKYNSKSFNPMLHVFVFFLSSY